MWDTLPQHLKLCEHKLLSNKARIKTSHERCRRAGVDSELILLDDTLNDSDLAHLLTEQSVLVGHAREMFTQVHRQLLDRSALFLLTNKQMRVLEIFSAPEVIRRCTDIGIRPGASLAEDSCGTNAVALAARHREPSVVKGRQHYCRVFQNWLCVAVPIADNHGELVGCLDISLSALSDLGSGLALASLLAHYLEAVVSPEQTPEARTLLVGTIPRRQQNSISTTQMSIVAALRQGMTYKQISAQLGVSTRTVESHIERLREKFNAKTTVQLIAQLGRTLPPSLEEIDQSSE